VSADPPRHIALLRAINLGPYNTIAMADLKALLAALGFSDAQTLLQSGNVVFSGGSKTTIALERMLERAAAGTLGLRTEFFVRTAQEWQAIVDANPFPQEATNDPGHLVALVVKDALTPSAVTALQQAIVGREVVRATGRCAYIVYPDGIGRSKLTSAVIEKTLGTRGTARNWNTVLKLGALVSAKSATST
jgi:uncharacterized protein (DUF1697 family)